MPSKYGKVSIPSVLGPSSTFPVRLRYPCTKSSISLCHLSRVLPYLPGTILPLVPLISIVQPSLATFHVTLWRFIAFFFFGSMFIPGYITELPTGCSVTHYIYEAFMKRDSPRRVPLSRTSITEAQRNV
ncbi:hypothetical protein H4582DRAFT_1959300 [Lactarius indigo]|nr:hypothetical protein H4582DRAFT_1959300 [Lactarius indigo]